MASAKATADEEEASKAAGGGAGGARGAEQGRQGGAAQGASLASLLRRKSRSAWSSFDTIRPSGGETPSLRLQGPRPRVESRSAVVRQAAAGGMPLGLKRGRPFSARVGEEKPQCLNVSSVFLRCRFGRRRNLESELQLLGAEAAASAHSRTPFLSLSISADSRKCS